MKRGILSIALCALMMAGAVSVSAQHSGNQKRGKQRTEQAKRTERSPEEMAKHRTDRMKEQLSLDDAQYAKVLALNEARMERMVEQTPRSREEMEKLTDEQRAEMRAKMKEAREAYTAELKGILSGEQFAKYEEMQKNARERKPGQGRHPRGGTRSASATR